MIYYKNIISYPVLLLFLPLPLLSFINLAEATLFARGCKEFEYVNNNANLILYYAVN
jgi:hypothetical protein